jgi:hypothetical protein
VIVRRTLNETWADGVVADLGCQMGGEYAYVSYVSAAGFARSEWRGHLLALDPRSAEKHGMCSGNTDHATQ